MTTLNLIEAAGTEDVARRHSLICLLRELSRGTRPLATPNTMLKIVARAHAQHNDRPTITCPDEEDSIWIAMNSPGEMDEEARQEAFQWKISLEAPFTESHRESRPHLQSLFESGQVVRPKSIASVIRFYRDNDQEFLDSLTDLYQNCTHQSLSRSDARIFLRDIPHWRLYYAGWGHAIYSRAIKWEAFGPRGKPGTLDLWCAIYLPYCDIFVTDDKPQRRALRLLNVLNNKKTRVISYNEMRNGLIINA